MDLNDSHPIRLSGGVNEVTRVGNELLRPSSGPAVHAFLNYLASRGFQGAPRLIRVEPDGTEVLSWAEGTVFPDSELADMPDQTLPAVARTMAELHALGADFLLIGGTGWTCENATGREPTTICHNDIAPRNTVLHDGGPQTLIDWDLAGPEIAEWDLAHAVWQFTPLDNEEGCRQRGFERPPDQWERLRSMVTAYGLSSALAPQFPDLISLRIRTTLIGIQEKVRRREPAFVRLASAGVLEDLNRQLRWVEGQRGAILRVVA